jgi:hypothetical protein
MKPAGTGERLGESGAKVTRAAVLVVGEGERGTAGPAFGAGGFGALTVLPVVGEVGDHGRVKA